MDTGFILAAIVVVFILLVLFSAIKVVQEYERGVVFRLGRLVGARGPGLILLIPFLERMQKIDLRTVTMDIPAQEVITRDNVTVRVNAVAYFRVLDPNSAVVNVADYIRATSQIAQTTLRSVLGQSSLDDLLSQRDQINQTLQQIIDEQTEPWGVKVSVVEVKDVELPQSMQRAMARQAEAEREKRAKIIHAEGEYQAAEQLADAAEIINQNPVTIQLRYLQTLTEIGAEKNTTIAFPVPVDMLSAIMGGNGNGSSDRPKPSSPRPAPTQPAPSQPDAPETPERNRPIPRHDLEGAPPPRKGGPIEKA
ncbi:MAG TPA: SPFH domain-containing protein [Thermomicrobiales bacterium]|jgi:regulator of protease activity HflC (stomatin/prohibitin superfamily)|nr:SPFH domain-containing protein [Thermomicrobiales bacterium]